ncbi:MAG: methyltransferase domain-containing protein [Candidatus Omnitrophica bacterium]|nr:methyltransferase domain-containing protein [Candidatus Omnitrophota bacterium]
MKKEFRKKLFQEHNKKAEEAYIADRTRKAEKIKAVLHDSGKRSGSLLDIGCSLGIISASLKDGFDVTGIDPDEEAVNYARAKWPGIRFSVQSGERMDFPDGSFDAAVCAGIYEHVDDPGKLVKEIWRVLKPGGVCYFTAMNRLIPIEPHYKLPFLSYFPKPLADAYLGLAGGGAYDVRSFCLPGLKKMVSDFKVSDYTVKVINDPVTFRATDMVSPGSLGQRAAVFVSEHLYWLVPTYIWILRKESDCVAIRK